jgi:DNA mismatch repair protein MutH
MNFSGGGLDALLARIVPRTFGRKKGWVGWEMGIRWLDMETGGHGVTCDIYSVGIGGECRPVGS